MITFECVYEPVCSSYLMLIHYKTTEKKSIFYAEGSKNGSEKLIHKKRKKKFFHVFGSNFQLTIEILVCA